MKELNLNEIQARGLTHIELLEMSSRDLKTIKEIALNAAYVNDQTGEYGNSARVLIHIAEMIEEIDNSIEKILMKDGVYI